MKLRRISDFNLNNSVILNNSLLCKVKKITKSGLLLTDNKNRKYIAVVDHDEVRHPSPIETLRGIDKTFKEKHNNLISFIKEFGWEEVSQLLLKTMAEFCNERDGAINLGKYYPAKYKNNEAISFDELRSYQLANAIFPKPPQLSEVQDYLAKIISTYGKNTRRTKDLRTAMIRQIRITEEINGGNIDLESILKNS